MKGLWVGLLWGIMSTAFAFDWQDLWVTKDKQAELMMQKGQFKQAEDTFIRNDWRAASAYRAGDYEKAITGYRSLSGADSDFNQGNAWARLGKYQEAIAAYDKALQKNPHHEDAEYNRNLIKDKLKQQQQQQQQKDQTNQKNQSSHEQKTDEQPSPSQDKSSEDASQQEPPSSQQKPQDTSKQPKPATDHDVKQDKPEQDKQPKAEEPDASPQKEQTSRQSEAKADEHQQANEQWLRLIPDDPGGLLREKFLRDHLRRQRGWQP